MSVNGRTEEGGAYTQWNYLPFVIAPMDLEGTGLGEISQTEKDKFCVASHRCGVKPIDTESRVVVEEAGGRLKWGKGVKGYKLELPVLGA